jgi:hypothetical protein
MEAIAQEIGADRVGIHPAAEFNRSPTLQRLLATLDEDDFMLTPADELAALQLQAAREVFAVQKDRVQVLKRRAEETGICEIESKKDIVPMLFAHSVYKSYPISFIAKGHWGRLLKWYSTLTSVPVDNVDVDGVEDIDEFIGRLWDAGHKAFTSSGTSGKVSILARLDSDYQVFDSVIARHHCWPMTMPAERMPYYQMTPKYGYYIIMATSDLMTRRFALPGEIRFLSEDRLSVASLMRSAEMRKRIGEGAASPSEIGAFEAEAAMQQAKAIGEFEAIADEIIDNFDKPIFLSAQWGMLWRLVEKARERGLKDGAMHPGSVIATGGGTKGLVLPPDFQEQTWKFLGPIHFVLNVYGMSEMSTCYPACEHGKYHIVPWIMPFILDAPGEKIVEPVDGISEGRFAWLDLSYGARWGGLISGDRVIMDHAATCSCGRPGPVILPQIARFTGPGEDDKIGCAGTIESYIRGAIAE